MGRNAHLLHVFSTFVPAGPEMRTVGLIAGLGDEFQHSIVAMDGRTSAADQLPQGAPVRVLESPPRAGSLTTTWRLRRLIARERPGLVLTYNWGAFDALFAAKSLGLTRIVHHEDGFTSEEANRFLKRRILARRLMLRRVQRVVVPSRRLEEIARGLWKLPAQRVLRIPNGVRIERFAPRDGNPELRQRLGIPREAFVIGSVGHLRAEKNYPRLVQAAASLEQPVHVLLLGEGPERETIEAAGRDLSRRLHLVGHQSDPEPYYRAMDVFCLSSDTEQMPVALLEAMACELPVVSTPVGDVASILPPEQESYLADLAPDGAQAMAAALDRLAHDPAQRSALGRANRERVAADYSFEGMLAAYRAVYRAGLEA